MSAFLSTIIADVLAKLLQSLGGDISSYIAQVRKTDAQRADRLAAAQASVKPLKESTDGKSEDQAADSSLGGV